MAEKLTICLIGPKKGGKSSVLATLTDCGAQRAHGYPPQLRPALQPITAAEFDSASGADARLKILGVLNGEYARLRREFMEGGVATDTLNTYEYFFRLELNGSHQGISAEGMPILIQVVDAAGEIAFPQDAGVVNVDEGVRDKFDGQILNADALVFVVPLVNL